MPFMATMPVPTRRISAWCRVPTVHRVSIACRSITVCSILMCKSVCVGAPVTMGVHARISVAVEMHRTLSLGPLLARTWPRIYGLALHATATDIRPSQWGGLLAARTRAVRSR